MKRAFVRITNHWTYPLTSVVVIVMLAFLLSANGITTLDILVLASVLILAIVAWRMLLTTQTGEMTDEQAVMHTIRRSHHPTVLEFYSRYCVGCMAMKPIVDRLEAEAGENLNIIRLNIDEEPGSTLMNKYGVIFTPTFLFFDADGNKQSESIGVIDRARILYAIEGEA